MRKRSGSDTVPALARAFLECPHCGRIPKPGGTLLVHVGNESPDHVHCRFRCDRCGSDAAMLYLERELMPVN